MGRARVVRKTWPSLWPLGSAPARRSRPVPEQPPLLRRAAVRAERTVRGSRMSSHSHISAVLVVFMALAVGAGAELLTEKSCDVVGDESTESQMEKALLKKLEPLSQIRFNTTVEIGTTENYAYHFRVCREVNSSLHDFAGVVQMDRQSGKTTVIGRINETQVFNGSDWIMLIYKGGDSYGRHCSGEKRRAVIMISCKRGITASSFSIISEEREKEQDCFYLFEMDSSVACPVEDSHLSTGSILLITFSSVIAVYIIGGFLYQRLIVGAKGMEQFPHFAFWQDLGNLVADGCDFVCRSKKSNVNVQH
uniref:Cation-dependent mannose-6-phosphate receptor n=1 Tax=Meleagris gallopavo TaxID=9103 RepID=A0A803XW18_MELGA